MLLVTGTTQAGGVLVTGGLFIIHRQRPGGGGGGTRHMHRQGGIRLIYGHTHIFSSTPAQVKADMDDYRKQAFHKDADFCCLWAFFYQMNFSGPPR